MIETTSQFNSPYKKEFSDADKSAYEARDSEKKLIKSICATALFKKLEKYDGMEKVMLKGGFLLANTVPNSRMTQDIDVSVFEYSEWEYVLSCFKDIVENDDNLSLTFIEPYGVKCGNIKINFEKEQAEVKVDVELSKPITTFSIFSILDVVIGIQPLEGVLVDKLSALYGEGRFRRTKDLYDIYNILTNYDFSYADVSELESKSGNTINEQNKLVTDATILRFKSKWENLILKERVANNAIELPKPNVTEVLKVIADFVMRLKLYERGESDESFWEHSVHK